MSAESKSKTDDSNEPKTVTMIPCDVPGCGIEKSDPAHLYSHFMDDHTFDEWCEAMKGDPVEREIIE